MCLLITRTTSYNKSKFRYKILELQRDGKYFSFYRGDEWEQNKLIADSFDFKYTTKSDLNIAVFHGIHVFITKQDALKVYNTDFYYRGAACVVKVKVNCFLGAGKHINFLGAGKHIDSSENADEKRGEIWKNAEIVELIRTPKNHR